MNLYRELTFKSCWALENTFCIWNTWQSINTSEHVHHVHEKSIENLLFETLSPKLLKEIPNLFLSGVRIETIHLTDLISRYQQHPQICPAGRVQPLDSSPLSYGVHRCCAMATAWRTGEYCIRREDLTTKCPGSVQPLTLQVPISQLRWFQLNLNSKFWLN